MAYLAWYLTEGNWSLLGTHRTQQAAKDQCADHAFAQSGFVKSAISEATMLMVWTPCRNGITAPGAYEGRYEVIETEAGP